ncbi:MAG: GNAT family N-acetyltransferase [Candidatus Zixiibacteriota bacterium]
MKFQIETFTNVGAQEWEQLSFGASFYGSRDWSLACSHALSGDVIVLTLRDRKKLIGGFPGIITTRLGMKTLASMPFGTYGGVVWRDAPSDAQQQAFREGFANFLTDQSIGKAHVADYSGTFSALNIDGFSTSRHSTQILSLGREPYRPDKKTMTEIKKGEQVGGEIRQLNDASAIDSYFDLYKHTEARHGRKKLLYSHEFFNKLLSSLLSSPKLYWIGLFDGDRMLGAQIHFIDGDCQYYWQAASADESRDYRTDYRLLYNAIQCGQSRGVREMNMGASPDDAHGLVFFKKRWGSVKKVYAVFEYKSNFRKLIGR